MGNNQNPFSLYDFLGYFTPGAVFLYVGIAVSERFVQFNFHENIKGRGFHELETYVGLVILAYIIGLALSLLSSVFIEKFSIWRYGYPSKYLTSTSHHGYFKSTSDEPELISCPNVLARLIVWVFLLPVSLLDWIFGDLLNRKSLYVGALDHVLNKIVWAKVGDLLTKNSGLSKPPSGESWYRQDYFRFLYHYVLVNSEVHAPSLKNYVALYGFSRTMTFLFVVMFWGSFILLCKYHFQSNILLSVFVASIPMSFIYYMNFNKFFRRYSLEDLMAVAVIHKRDMTIDPDLIN